MPGEMIMDEIILAEEITLLDTVIATMSNLIESRDDLKDPHIKNIRKEVGSLLAAMDEAGLYQEQRNTWINNKIVAASQLHDIGKIAISDRILGKIGRLNPEEFDTIKQHTTFGVEIIDKIEESLPKAAVSSFNFLQHAKLFAAAHHEKWDGSGYPAGLSGANIPLEGRIMAIIDVYDALVSERPYKKAFTRKEAIKIIKDGKGSHFDPAIVDCFLNAAQ
ncbi:hypothetical protein FACS1894151_03240 [Spirochaetia bacterium]|nr:hypothetical protein FACS1894151_03240 [Spirochaetia bacterium]